MGPLRLAKLLPQKVPLLQRNHERAKLINKSKASPKNSLKKTIQNKHRKSLIQYKANNLIFNKMLNLQGCVTFPQIYGTRKDSFIYIADQAVINFLVFLSHSLFYLFQKDSM